MTNPDALQVWRLRDQADKLTRKHTSVRPWDKRSYKGPEIDALMARLPAFEGLSSYAKDVWGDGKNYSCSKSYSRSRVLPFVMALDEDDARTRAGYEKILGLYGHGYPSFYRRATVVVMQRIAKELAGTNIGEVSKSQRKQAWKIARREIRRLYHTMSA